MQARLDAEWADRSLPWIVAAVLGALLLAASLAVVRQMDAGPGLAVWKQAAWHVRHGQAPGSSIAGVDPVISQWSFTAWPFLWLTRWIPATQVLAGAQASALALAVVPIWKLARDAFGLRVGTTLAVVSSYALSPAVHAANLTPFRPEVMAVPAFAGAVLFRRRARWVPYGACVAVVLATRADLGFTIAALGLVVLLDGDRLAGAVTAVAGLAWSIAAIVALDPHLPTSTLTPAQAFATQGLAPLAEARALVSDPTQVFGNLLDQYQLPVVVAVFAPMLFLGFAAPRTLLPAIPPFVLGAVGGRAVYEATGMGAQSGVVSSSRVLVAVVPVTIAGLVAVSRIGHRSVTRVNVDHRLVGAMVVATLVLFAQNAPSSPYQHPWAWGGRDVADGARMAAIDKVPDRVAVTVSPQLGPWVAERTTVREVGLAPPPPSTWRQVATPVVLLDTTGTNDLDQALWTEADRRAAERALVAAGYGVAYRGQGILLFTR